MSTSAGRHTAVVPDSGVVVFLIGMRINALWRVRQWLPVSLAMPKMLVELMRNPSLGLIGKPRTFLSGRTIFVLQYWQSFDALEAYARDSTAEHLPAWRAFNRRARASTAVGIFHETYVVGPSTAESMYVHMPPFGLGAATGTLPVSSSSTARDRITPS